MENIIQIAFYKGPPESSDLVHVITHNAIKIRTWSKYSHAELVIDGTCYSSSVRDKGVRSKQINLNSGRWDVVRIDNNRVDILYALAFFALHDGSSYDWNNIVRFVLPFVKQEENKFICFEFIGRMLNHSGCHRLDADDLYAWAKANEYKPKGEYNEIF